MANDQLPLIHPTAVISAEAELADSVQVGPFAVVEGKVVIGEGCILGPHTHLSGPLTLGRRNRLFTGVVLGERPQHLRYQDEPTSVEIGDDNTFREHVTVHRGTSHSWKTVIGNNNFLMVNSHIGHDCVVGNNCILANGALVGGHCTLADGAYLSGNCAVHQFVAIGRLALLSGGSVTTKDMPPFITQQGFNCVVGINLVGMRRAGMNKEQIDAVHRAVNLIFFQNQVVTAAMSQVEKELGHIDAVAELLAFVRSSKRGINSARDRNRKAAA